MEAQQNLSVEERVSVLENQLYMLYLQANTVTKLLLEAGVLTADQVTKEMESLNQEIFKVTSEGLKTDQGTQESDETVEPVESE